MAIDIPLVSLATNDIAPSDVVNDLLTAEDRGKQHLVSNVQKRLIDGSVQFHDSIKKHFKNFWWFVQNKSINQSTWNEICEGRQKLIQRLLMINAVIAGRPVEMNSIMKHELSTVLLSIAKVGGDVHSVSKAELIDILKGQINIPSELPEADMKTCVLIDGHALISWCSIWSLHWRGFHQGQHSSKEDWQDKTNPKGYWWATCSTSTCMEQLHLHGRKQIWYCKFFVWDDHAARGRSTRKMGISDRRWIF